MFSKCFSFEKCSEVPVRGGRWGYGGLVEVQGEVQWGGFGGVYRHDDVKSCWERVAEDCEGGATLATYGDKLVAVGSEKGGTDGRKRMRVWENGKWENMPKMLIGCRFPCVVSVSNDCLVVMGGEGNHNWSRLKDVQIFDGKTQTWSIGPSLPQACVAMSAVVHDRKIIVMGGGGMGRSVWCVDISDMISTQARIGLRCAWKRLPDVPYYRSTVCVIDNVILSIGGKEEESGSITVSTICALRRIQHKWQPVGDIPFKCHYVNTLSLLHPQQRLLVIDGSKKNAIFVKVDGLAKLLNPQEVLERHFYEEAMAKGYVETSITKCLIIGAAGVGKTHLKHLLLKKDPPEQRTSTGLAENPVRTITCSLVDAGVAPEDDWFVVEDTQALMNAIGRTIKSDHHVAASVVDELSTDITEERANPCNDETDRDPVADNVNDMALMGGIVSLEKELINHINNSTGITKRFGKKLIHFIDSGGQMQYHDILPLFVQNINVAIFVLNLSEELSHYPTVEYFESDKQIGKSNKSSLSHEQILQYLLRAVCSRHPTPHIFTVGTHRDAEHVRSESHDKKNLRLLELLQPVKDYVIYKGQMLTKTIFPVNAKTPEDEDKCVAQELRRKIISLSSTQSQKLPYAWFGLEILLKKSSDNGILSLEKCKMCAKRLYIEGDSFWIAFNHLVQQSVLLYYEDVLPQTVLCNPQVVLTKVTELVHYQQKLKNSPDKTSAVEGELIKFRDCGILTVNTLRQFPNNYKEDLFTPKDLLNLLISRGAVSKISDKEYVMPALMPHLDDLKVPKCHQDITPLIISSIIGCIPSGLFCRLMAHLLSTSNKLNWKVCMVRNQPKHLYRNSVSFVQHSAREIVTLVDMFSYIEVRVECKDSVENCKEIKECILSGIESACNALQYDDVHFEEAFLCTGAECALDPPHHAVVASYQRDPNQEIIYEWTCTLINHQRGPLSKHQLMWFQAEQAAQVFMPVKATFISSAGVKTQVELSTLQEDLADLSGDDWYIVGIQLDVPIHILDDICDKFRNDCKHQKQEMLKYWTLHSTGTQADWKALVDALSLIGYGNLSNTIERKYLSNTEDTATIMTSNKMELSLKILQRELCDVSCSWYSLGVELNIPDPFLKNISHDFKNCNRQILEMLKYWINNAVPSWKTLVDALLTIQQEMLSQSIKSKYLHC